MTSTRGENAKMAYEKMITELLEHKLDGPIDRALRNAIVNKDIRLVMNLTPMDISTLVYQHKDDIKYTPLAVGYKNLIRCVQSFYWYRKGEENDIDSSWSNVDIDSFEQYRMNEFDSADPHTRPSKITGSLFSPPSQLVSRGTAEHKTLSLVDQFKKGIKRDASVFPVLKEGRQFDDWQGDFVTIAESQGLEEIIDVNYRPLTTDGNDLFNEKQKFMYSVLRRTLKTDRGKHFVRYHENDRNAQEVYKKTVNYYLKSRKTSIESRELLSYLTSARFGTGNWKGTAVGFISHWQDKMRLYNKQVPSVNHRITDLMQITMMQNAVEPNRDLRSVVDQEDQHKTHTGNELTYDQYCDLLLSAATAYDEGFKSKHSTTPRRSIYQHNIDTNVESHQDYAEVEGYESFNIDTPIDTIQSFSTNFKNKNKFINQGSRIPVEKWKRLDTRSKRIWNQLDQESRRIILSNDNNEESEQEPKRENTHTHTNLHDISVLDFIRANLHHLIDEGEESSQTSQEIFQDCQDCEDNTDNERILVNAVKGDYTMTGKNKNQANNEKKTTSSTISPADIRSLLSTSKSRKANIHVTYSISRHDVKKDVSLIDRGANGGIAGEDIRIIDRTHRKVHVQGIDNHQLNNIPIVTAGGVLNTQRGEVIAIYHQYAYTGKGSSIHSSGQLEWNANIVCDKSVRVGGKQRIMTPDG